MKIQAFLLALLGLILPRTANADSPKATIEVRGIGEVTIPSDTIVLRLSVAVVRNDLQEAKNRNDQLTNQIYELAESQRLPQPTLLNTALSSFDSNPYQFGKGGKNNKQQQQQQQDVFEIDESSKPAKPSIRISRDVEVKFAEFSRSVRFLADVTKWESFQNSREITFAPLMFGVANMDKYSSEVRRRAVASATAKAKHLADESGQKLGDAIRVFDDSSDSVDPFSVPEPRENPFAAPFVPGARSSALPNIRFVALGEDRPKDRRDLDEIPPARVTIRAGVRMVFEMHKP